MTLADAEPLIAITDTDESDHDVCLEALDEPEDRPPDRVGRVHLVRQRLELIESADEATLEPRKQGTFTRATCLRLQIHDELVPPTGSECQLLGRSRHADIDKSAVEHMPL